MDLKGENPQEVQVLRISLLKSPSIKGVRWVTSQKAFAHCVFHPECGPVFTSLRERN